MCRVNITGGECPQEEINAYIARGQQLYGREPDAIDIRLDGEDIYAKDMDVSVLRPRVGMVFQKPNPFPMSIWWARSTASTTPSAPRSATA